MGELTFSFNEIPSGSRIDLVAAPVSSVSDGMWPQLADNLALEKILRPCSASELERRWKQGQARIVIKDGSIISYASLVPIFFPAVKNCLASELGLESSRMQIIDLSGLSTLWTDPQWRRRSIQTQLSSTLLESFKGPNNLHIAVTSGLAASPVLANLGWRLMGWNRIPYAGSLAGLPVVGFEDRLVDPYMVPKDIVQYEGPHIVPATDNTHDWDRFCHLWVSNELRAMELDTHLSELLIDKGLQGWREAIVLVCAIRRESPWTLNFF